MVRIESFIEDGKAHIVIYKNENYVNEIVANSLLEALVLYSRVKDDVDD